MAWDLTREELSDSVAGARVSRGWRAGPRGGWAVAGPEALPRQGAAWGAQGANSLAVDVVKFI